VLVNKKLVVGTIQELRQNQDPWIQEYFSGVRGRAALADMDVASKGAEAH
jgi:phospholipid/cholesterol/gamma-HCH transport system ATP-binding protein